MVVNPAMGEESLKVFLDQFNENPRSALSSLPEKTIVDVYPESVASDVFNRQLKSSSVLLSQPSNVRETGAYLTSETYYRFRDKMRAEIIGNSIHFRARNHDSPVLRPPVSVNDLNEAKNLVDNKESFVSNLFKMQGQGLMQAKLDSQPWSDSYWPLYNGSLGYRYAEKNWPNVKYSEKSKAWQKYYDFAFEEMPLLSYIDSKNTDFLSPSEKYDLLVGDKNYNLTNESWNEGKKYFDSYGKVETWMGVCHGWAPAAYMLPRPKRSVMVTAVNGEKIKFFPSDLKALGTKLWAEGQYKVKFAGKRCYVKKPKVDEVGRIIEPGCNDVNPGLWHQSVVNQIGIAKRSLVMDATYDYEVWNQPILSYSYQYFNPQTDISYGDALDAYIPIEVFTKDKFKKYRAQNATHIVGVKMSVYYVLETHPNQREEDTPKQDRIAKVQYVYDLELNAAGDILGGEWYQNAHPDFLWAPEKNARVGTVADYWGYQNQTWDVSKPFPQAWSTAAAYASANGQPMTNVVQALFEASNKEEVVIPEPRIYPAWNRYKRYLKGDRVRFNGNVYEAKFRVFFIPPSWGWGWHEIES